MAKHKNVFAMSDPHFGHENTWKKFKNFDGTPMRPFSSTGEMNEYMVEAWNNTVGDNDLVLLLGDVCFTGRVYDAIMPRLRGDKYLIRGNHDTLSEARYRRHFKRVLGAYVRHDYIYTHVPIHPDSVGRFEGNIHGHLHASEIDDPRYFNVSVERVGYVPALLEDIHESMENNWKDWI